MTKVVAAFDFDGTITKADTFVPFLYRAFGRLWVYTAMTRLLPDVLMMPLGLSSRDRIKEKIIAALFAGEPCQRFDVIAAEYAESVKRLYRPAAIERIIWHQKQGHRCVMVSASLDIYLHMVSQSLGFDNLLCTTLERCDGFFTGRLIGGNCRRREKVARLTALLGDLSAWKIYAYGDSAGDEEMLGIADVPHMQPF